MVKVKKTQPVKEEVVNKEENVMENIPYTEEEKTQFSLSKETICEFYWIRDEEIFDKSSDLSKYGIKKWEEAILREWAEQKKAEDIKEVSMDRFDLEWHPNAAVLIEKYGIQPYHVVDDKLEELGLSKDEAKLIKDFYDDEILRLYKKVNHIE